ncbi:hypothetical protein H5410_031587 [Solanum commersonii]|uniref:Uncharacterized protein n=1 Tax=Solanum commersonii TaxID=4109 RepID=A0A9J5YIS2_SOLCO|nr:hypothetical protein H5410_031587 [Solanum commersonii]
MNAYDGNLTCTKHDAFFTFIQPVFDLLSNLLRQSGIMKHLSDKLLNEPWEFEANESSVAINESFIATFASNVAIFDSYVATNGSYVATYASNVATFDSYVATHGSSIKTYASNIATFDSYIVTHGSSVATYASNVSIFDLYVVFGSSVATYASYGQMLLHKGDMLQHLRHL